MSEVPTAVSESTAAEIVRKEGSARSAKSVDATIVAGVFLKLNSSGALRTVGTENPDTVFGVALYQAISGNRVTAIRGHVRAFWDGAGTVNPGSEIGLSTTFSGWFTGSVSGPNFAVGFYSPLPGGVALAAANSGTLQPVETYG